MHDDQISCSQTYFHESQQKRITFCMLKIDLPQRLYVQSLAAIKTCSNYEFELASMAKIDWNVAWEDFWAKQITFYGHLSNPFTVVFSAISDMHLQYWVLHDDQISFFEWQDWILYQWYEMLYPERERPVDSKKTFDGWQSLQFWGAHYTKVWSLDVWMRLLNISVVYVSHNPTFITFTPTMGMVSDTNR